MSRTTGLVDISVGKRVRSRRLALGLSQQELGDQIGVTFQQIQKYEKGTNRISASRLSLVSRALAVPVSYFFDEFRNDTVADGAAADEGEFLLTDQGVELARSFCRIKNPGVRRRLVDLVVALSEADADSVCGGT